MAKFPLTSADHAQYWLLDSFRQGKGAEALSSVLQHGENGQLLTAGGYPYIPRWQRDEAFLSQLGDGENTSYIALATRRPVPGKFADFGHVFLGMFHPGKKEAREVHFSLDADALKAITLEPLPLLNPVLRAGRKMLGVPATLKDHSTNARFAKAVMLPITEHQYELLKADIALDELAIANTRYTFVRSGGLNCVEYSLYALDSIGIPLDTKKLMFGLRHPVDVMKALDSLFSPSATARPYMHEVAVDNHLYQVAVGENGRMMLQAQAPHRENASLATAATTALSLAQVAADAIIHGSIRTEVSSLRFAPNRTA